MEVEKRNRLLSIVLGIIIVALGYWLYHSIVDPYQEVVEREEMREQVRQQMKTVRDALVQHERIKGDFPPTEGGLDSLVAFLKNDSTMVAQGDSLFSLPNQSYNPDSLIYSPRPPHPKFEYTLNDTLRPRIYLLEDPATDDHIGSMENTTDRNAASWE